MITPLLSICIATFNRPRELVQVLLQIQDLENRTDIELVVVDSSEIKDEEVESILARLGGKHIWTGVACGIDQDYDLAIQNSLGKYCWLLPDDDRVITGAINKIVDATKSDAELILVNASVYNVDYTKKLSHSLISNVQEIENLKNATAKNLSRFSNLLTYIGCVVIKREVWLANASARFFGTEFVHVGIILSSLPMQDIVVIPEPQVEIRYGQAHWKNRYAKIWWINWENLIRTYISDPQVLNEWGISFGRKRLVNIFLVKALGNVSAIDVRYRTQSYPFLVRHILRIGTRLLPVLLLNFIFSAIFKVLGSEKYAVVLFDLADARRGSKKT